MSSKRRLAAVALSALLVLSVVGPAIAVAQTDEETDGGGLSVDVRNSGDDVVVVVEDENGSVDGATVTVSAVEETDDEAETDNETENGTTDDETDDEEKTDNETTGNETTDNETDSETADTETDGGYAGEGTYTTGADGTVELPAPDDGVRLQVSVDAGDRTTTSEVTVNGGVGVPFGQRVALLVQQLLQGDGNVIVGQAMSEFVRGDNPGNAPADAGPPEDRGNDSDAERGPSEDRGDDNDDSDVERGPPEDRGDSTDDDGDAERGPPEDRDDDGDDGDDDDDDGGNGGDGGAERRPPEDRGN
jgi:hypothetical protein